MGTTSSASSRNVTEKHGGCAYERWGPRMTGTAIQTIGIGLRALPSQSFSIASLPSLERALDKASEMS